MFCEQKLSGREMEICECVSRGLDNKQIGKQLGISEHTVKTHLRNIYSKTDTHNRTNLALSVLSSEQT
tara:strand:+ start:2892 stop:3095 length:204 start_codon:yes stop_codon:yes gene_type:complete